MRTAAACRQCSPPACDCDSILRRTQTRSQSSKPRRPRCHRTGTPHTQHLPLDCILCDKSQAHIRRSNRADKRTDPAACRTHPHNQTNTPHRLSKHTTHQPIPKAPHTPHTERLPWSSIGQASNQAHTTESCSPHNRPRSCSYPQHSCNRSRRPSPCCPTQPGLPAAHSRIRYSARRSSPCTSAAWSLRRMQGWSTERMNCCP